VRRRGSATIELTRTRAAATHAQDAPAATLALDAVERDAETVPSGALVAAVSAWLGSPAGGSHSVVEHCTVPLDSSQCSRCASKLRSIELPQGARALPPGAAAD